MSGKSKKLTRRLPTERSESKVAHVDAISEYNDRLTALLENEKAKDDGMRALEKQLYAEKLKHAVDVSVVSFGHELMEIEDKFDQEYSALEEEHDGVCAGLREGMVAYEEAACKLSLGDVEGVMLQAQAAAAASRERTLAEHLETMEAKLEAAKATEKATTARAAAAMRRNAEYKAEHETKFDRRHSNQDVRKGDEEMAVLVKEAQRLRAEHHALMKKLDAKEAAEIKRFEEEAAVKLADAEQKLKAQFSKEELRAIAKHDSYQRELQSELDRLEEKMKGKMQEEEASLRDKIKKLSGQASRSGASVEAMRQQVVDFLAERNVHATQLSHLGALGNERHKTFEKLAAEKRDLERELEAAKAAAKASAERRAKVAAKYALVVKQNKKMSEEIGKFGGLVARGESEVAFVPANKRIRLHQGK